MPRRATAGSDIVVMASTHDNETFVPGGRPSRSAEPAPLVSDDGLVDGGRRAELTDSFEAALCTSALAPGRNGTDNGTSVPLLRDMPQHCRLFAHWCVPV